MTTCECGREAYQTADTERAVHWRCTRGHTWVVPVFQADFFKTPERARDEAIARVDDSHDLWIERIALPAIERQVGEFTTDDVWRDIGDIVPPEPRAMGAAMMRAKREGRIRATGRYQKSVRAECHARPVLVWERVRGEMDG